MLTNCTHLLFYSFFKSLFNQLFFLIKWTCHLRTLSMSVLPYASQGIIHFKLDCSLESLCFLSLLIGKRKLNDHLSLTLLVIAFNKSPHFTLLPLANDYISYSSTWLIPRLIQHRSITAVSSKRRERTTKKRIQKPAKI